MGFTYLLDWLIPDQDLFIAETIASFIVNVVPLIPLDVIFTVVKWTAIMYASESDPRMGLGLWVGIELVSPEPFELVRTVGSIIQYSGLFPKIEFVPQPKVTGLLVGLGRPNQFSFGIFLLSRFNFRIDDTQLTGFCPCWS